MLTTNSNKKYTGFKTLGYGVLASIGSLNSALIVFAADSQNGDNRSYIPTFRANPEYPAQAVEEQLVGWVRLQYTIDEMGSVRELIVIDNCVRSATADESSCTAGDLFDAVSIAALAQWKYEPVMENGTAIKVEGMQSLLRYQLQNEPADGTSSEE